MTEDTNGVETGIVMAAEEIEAKILHILAIYPVISPTMLQGGIGPYLKPATWRPVLKQLIEDGKVIESQESVTTPAGRYNNYAKLSLPGVEVTGLPDLETEVG